LCKTRVPQAPIQSPDTTRSRIVVADFLVGRANHPSLTLVDSQGIIAVTF
jgi:hypothetical protein